VHSSDVTLCAVCGEPVSAAGAVFCDYRLYCCACFARGRDRGLLSEPDGRDRRRSDRCPGGSSTDADQPAGAKRET